MGKTIALSVNNPNLNGKILFSNMLGKVSNKNVRIMPEETMVIRMKRYTNHSFFGKNRYNNFISLNAEFIKTLLRIPLFI